jgi:capsular exopolysaccharide synthesis family protein
MQDRSNEPNNQLIVPTGPAHESAKVLYLEPLNSYSGSERRDPKLLSTWRIFRPRLPWLAVILIVGGVLGLCWSRYSKPVFRAHATLEIDNPTENAGNLRGADLQAEAALSSPEAYLPTQILILQSRMIRKRAGVKFGDHQPPVTVKIRVEPNSRIVQILCDSPNAQFSADYANAIANEYIEQNLQANWDAFRRTREWLARQLEETRGKLEKSENELVEYERASNLILDGKESDEQLKLRHIQEELVRAQADRVQKQSAYRTASSKPADWVPQVMDNVSITDYKNQSAALRKQIADLLPQLTPEHYRIKRLQAQLDEVQTTLQRERDNVLARVRTDYESALTRENLLTATYQRQAQVVSLQTQKTINYNILEREAATNRQLYASLLQRSKEADATAMRGSNVRIIDSAEPPTTSYEPSFRNNTLLGAFSGLLIGMALILLRETFDRSFRVPGEVTSQLRLPELGVIPVGHLIGRNGHEASWKKPLLLSFSGTPGLKENQSIELATWFDKSSIIAESFRNVVASILYSPQGSRPRVILVTSAIRNEGKTTVVSNLGITLAEINQRVLLIDGDMRKPRLSSVFNVSNDWGLSNILREKECLRDCPLEAIVKRTEMPELSVLTSGPGTSSISNLLYSTRMLELLQRLRSEFDTILIDTPPMLDISDARILGHLADAVVLVFNARTSRDAALAAKRRLSEDGIPVLGTILNAWDFRRMSSYEAYQQSYQPA